MKRTDDDDASDTVDPSRLAAPNQGNRRQLATRENDRRRRGIAVIDDASTILNREILVAAREKDVQLREDAATLREREICTAEMKQVASDDHMIVMQQANAHLVIATIESNKLAEQLKIAKDQLEIANLAKSDFLSRMSHELRTPLNAILDFAQLLEVGSPPPTDAQLLKLNQIIKAGWYLLELINQILDLAVIESGKLSLSREPVSLINVMHECQAMIEPQAKKRDIHIDFLPIDNTWFVNADQTRVKQVLINLLSNAIKYNREHGTVEVKCTSSPDRIRLSIKDSGAGLSVEKLA